MNSNHHLGQNPNWMFKKWLVKTGVERDANSISKTFKIPTDHLNVAANISDSTLPLLPFLPDHSETKLVQISGAAILCWRQNLQ